MPQKSCHNSSFELNFQKDLKNGHFGYDFPVLLFGQKGMFPRVILGTVFLYR